MHGTSVMKQMVRRYSDNSGKKKEEKKRNALEGIPFLLSFVSNSQYDQLLSA